jgi:hypothetical protein
MNPIGTCIEQQQFTIDFPHHHRFLPPPNACHRLFLFVYNAFWNPRAFCLPKCHRPFKTMTLRQRYAPVHQTTKN